MVLRGGIPAQNKKAHKQPARCLGGGGGAGFGPPTCPQTHSESCATNSRNFGDNEVSSYRGARHLFVPAQPEALALGDLGQMV